MQYKYYCQKYLELLKYNDLLRKQNKSLEGENRPKYRELLNCSLRINEHLYWSQKTRMYN